MQVKHTYIIYIYCIDVYVKYIKIYVCEINMFFTYKLSFWKSALLKENSINKYNTNRKKEEVYGISVTHTFCSVKKQIISNNI